MKKSPNKKVFVSSKSDRGILVKILNQKVSLSFWGDGNPKNISFSKEEALDLCAYVIENINEQASDNDKEEAITPFDEAHRNLKNLLPDRHL